MRRSRPSILPSLRASVTPSVKKQAVDPRGSVTVLWRIPVCDVIPIGGDEHAVTGSNSPGPTTMGGGCPAEEYVSQLFADHLIHGWDLAVGLGTDRTLDPEAVRACLDWFEGREEMYRAGGAIGPRVDVADDASAQDRLLGAFGRDPKMA